MLREILSPHTCAACRLCCGFVASDLWELPILPEETVDVIHTMGVCPELIPFGAEQTFAAPALSGDMLFFCPMLREDGCAMGEEKPFDCHIWPFRMMRTIEGKVHITVASICPAAQQLSDQVLHDFLSQGLAQKILAYAIQHPDHIKPMSTQYRVIW